MLPEQALEPLEKRAVKDRNAVYDLISLVNCLAVTNRAVYDYSYFPGKQAIDLNIGCLERLDPDNYYVTEESKGERFLLLLRSRGEAYLISQSLNFFRVELGLLPREAEGTNTLLDGELVIDSEVSYNSVGGEKRRYIRHKLVYYVTDALTVCDVPLVSEPFFERLHKATGFLAWREQSQGGRRRTGEDFLVVIKQHEPADRTRALLERCHRLPHKATGLVFVPGSEPYLPGISTRLLHWHPLQSLSIRFLVDDVTRSAILVDTLEGPVPSPCPGLTHVRERWLYICDDNDKLRVETGGTGVAPLTLTDLRPPQALETARMQYGNYYSFLGPGEEASTLRLEDVRAIRSRVIVECIFDPLWYAECLQTKVSLVEGRPVTLGTRYVTLGGWRVRRVLPDQRLPSRLSEYSAIVDKIRGFVDRSRLLAAVEGRGPENPFRQGVIRTPGYDGVPLQPPQPKVEEEEEYEEETEEGEREGEGEEEKRE